MRIRELSAGAPRRDAPCAGTGEAEVKTVLEAVALINGHLVVQRGEGGVAGEAEEHEADRVADAIEPKHGVTEQLARWCGGGRWRRAEEAVGLGELLTERRLEAEERRDEENRGGRELREQPHVDEHQQVGADGAGQHSRQLPTIVEAEDSWPVGTLQREEADDTAVALEERKKLCEG